MAYDAREKLIDNIAALSTAFSLMTGQVPSSYQMTRLQRYSGFGGLKAILFDEGTPEDWKDKGAKYHDILLHKDFSDLYELLHQHYNDAEFDAVIKSVKNSVLTAFYTPEILPAALYRVLRENDITVHRLYEPSAGAGIFISEAAKQFPDLQEINAVEKDKLTGIVLQAMSAGLHNNMNVQVKGFEQTDAGENGIYDLLVSNMPFGDFRVSDPEFSFAITSKIHNYFFAKGLDKLADGGLMAYVTTNGFLNSSANKEARSYLFSFADLVSVTVLPDHLMYETGGTQAPSHLIVVQKRIGKESLSTLEKDLLEVVVKKNEFGDYTINKYLSQSQTSGLYMGEAGAGTNQYGKASESVVFKGSMAQLEQRLFEQLSVDFYKNFSARRYPKAAMSAAIQTSSKPQLNFLKMPESLKPDAPVQMGLFDTPAHTQNNGASAYLNKEDQHLVHIQTARIIGTLVASTPREHDCLVVITAKSAKNNFYNYKVCSNVQEIAGSGGWMNGQKLGAELKRLSGIIKAYDHQFTFRGDRTYEHHFQLAALPANLIKELKPFYVNGALVIHQQRVGLITNIDWKRQTADFTELEGNHELDYYNSYVRMRDQYHILFAIDAEKQNEGDNSHIRADLNKYYDHFIARYGELNKKENGKRIRLDAAFGEQLLSSLERRSDHGFVKSDIFRLNLNKAEWDFHSKDPVEALAYCLNRKGRVDLVFISEITGAMESHTRQLLGNHIYWNPANSLWEAADHYLSGNVVAKLKEAEILLNEQPDNGEIRNSFEALQKIQPERIPFEILDFNLGERWIPADYFSRYASELFDTPTKVFYLRSLDTFNVSVHKKNTRVTQEYAIRPEGRHAVYGYTILEHALKNTSPFFTKEVTIEGVVRRIPDNEATQQAHNKIENIRNGFLDWLTQLPQQEKDLLEQLYNDTFNCYKLRVYDGSHLTLPGIKLPAEIKEVYPSQKDAVWRIIQDQGALIDYEVGTGKTLIMIMAAQEMKRLGLINKPMILALKANVTQIAETYRAFYPNARILSPGEDDFSPRKRRTIVNEIKNNNWDCIILTHDQFEKIPQNPAIEKSVIENELDDLVRDAEVLRGEQEDESRAMLRGLEIRKVNLEVKLKTVEHRLSHRKDEGVTFEQTGIDHLFVDEAHKFKNLTFTTRHNRVAGLGNSSGSQKALNMLFAVRTLQERFNADLCVTFLTGTPISNSLTELFLIFKYLRPREMVRQGVEHFDGWASVFARKTTDFEFSVTNEIIAKERFRHFIKVPELALFYNEIAAYKTADSMGIDRPEIEERLVNLKPNPEQQEYSKKLMEFARTGNARLIDHPGLTSEMQKAKMLIATNAAKKMATDMRLISEKYNDHPENKVNTCASIAASIYQESHHHKGTQIIFSDLGTPKPDEFNIYDALKIALILQHGIPAEEISFIHDWRQEDKPKLFRMMNSGEIRILIGSTEKAGTGLNVQERLIALHHMDIPWKPSEFDQRNGRAARPGNWLAKHHFDNKVRVFIYGTEQSLDTYKFTLNKNKKLFIVQLKRNELHVRRIDEGGMDEHSGMNLSEYIAILSGDTSLLEKAKLEKKIASLQSLRTAHHREIARLQVELKNTRLRIDESSATLKKLVDDEGIYKQQLRFEKDGSKSNPVSLVGNDMQDAEVIGLRILKTYRDWKPAEGQLSEKIGSLYGFDLFIGRNLIHSRADLERYYKNKFLYAMRPESGIRYMINEGKPNEDNAKLAARYFINAIDRVSQIRSHYEGRIEDDIKAIGSLEEILSKPFGREHELSQLQAEVQRLEREINLKIQERQFLENGSLVNTIEMQATDNEVSEVKDRKQVRIGIKA